MIRRLLVTLILSITSLATTITTNNPIKYPSGRLFNGRIEFSLPAPAIDTSTSQVLLPGPTTVQIRNGLIALPLVLTLPGNDIVNPTMYYLATYYDMSGRPISTYNYSIVGSTFDLGSAPMTPVTTSNISTVDLTLRNLTVTGTFTAANMQGAIVMGTTQFPCTAPGFNSAIQLAAVSSGIINGYACAPTMTWSAQVNINQQVAIYMGMTTITCTGFTGPCLLYSSPSAFIGPYPGHPINSDSNQSTKLVAGTGFTGPLVKQQVGAGVRNVLLSNVTLDCNNFQTGVTAGVEIGTSQDNRAYYTYGATTGCPSAFITDSSAATPVRSFTIDHWSTQYVDTAINFGQAVIAGVTVTNSKFAVCVNTFIIGSDDSIAANQSSGIRLSNNDFTNSSNQAGCAGHSGSGNGLVRNVVGFFYDSYWNEDITASPSTGNAIIQLGTASSTPVFPVVIAPFSTCDGNGTTQYALEIVHATEPDIIISSLNCTTAAVKNTAQSGGGRVHCYGGATCIDTPTGLEEVIGTVGVTAVSGYGNVNGLSAPSGVLFGANNLCNLSNGGTCFFDPPNGGIWEFLRNASGSAQLLIEKGDGTNTPILTVGAGKNGIQLNELSTETGIAGKDEIMGNSSDHRLYASLNAAVAIPFVFPATTDTLTNKTIGALGHPFVEGSAPTCSAGNDFQWGDSTDHRLKMCNNNGTATDIAGLADFASPPTAGYGSATPEPVAATTITATGTITPSQTNGIIGTTTNNNVNAGGVGELQTCTVASGSSVSLTTGTTANICSINTLSAGDWDCSGAVDFTFGATTSYTNLVGGVSTTSATLGGQDTKFDFETPAAVPTATADSTWPLPTVRQSLGSATQVFLVAQATFTVSTMKAYGTLRCRRMR